MPAKFYLPVNLDLEHKKCLVVGAGKVAERKIRNLLSAGAKVIVVAGDTTPATRKLAAKNKIKLILRPFVRSDLIGKSLVIAATNHKKINQGIARACHKRRILVNVVDALSGSDFICPAYFQQGVLVVSVSTGGRSPLLAQKIRNNLKKHLYARH